MSKGIPELDTTFDHHADGSTDGSDEDEEDGDSHFLLPEECIELLPCITWMTNAGTAAEVTPYARLEEEEEGDDRSGNGSQLEEDNGDAVTSYRENEAFEISLSKEPIDFKFDDHAFLKPSNAAILSDQETTSVASSKGSHLAKDDERENNHDGKKFEASISKVPCEMKQSSGQVKGIDRDHNGHNGAPSENDMLKDPTLFLQKENKNDGGHHNDQRVLSLNSAYSGTLFELDGSQFESTNDTPTYQKASFTKQTSGDSSENLSDEYDDEDLPFDERRPANQDAEFPFGETATVAENEDFPFGEETKIPREEGDDRKNISENDISHENGSFLSESKQHRPIHECDLVTKSDSSKKSVKEGNKWLANMIEKTTGPLEDYQDRSLLSLAEEVDDITEDFEEYQETSGAMEEYQERSLLSFGDEADDTTVALQENQATSFVSLDGEDDDITRATEDVQERSFVSLEDKADDTTEALDEYLERSFVSLDDGADHRMGDLADYNENSLGTNNTNSNEYDQDITVRSLGRKLENTRGQALSTDIVHISSTHDNDVSNKSDGTLVRTSSLPNPTSGVLDRCLSTRPNSKEDSYDDSDSKEDNSDGGDQATAYLSKSASLDSSLPQAPRPPTMEDIMKEEWCDGSNSDNVYMSKGNMVYQNRKSSFPTYKSMAPKSNPSLRRTMNDILEIEALIGEVDSHLQKAKEDREYSKGIVNAREPEGLLIRNRQ